MDTAVVHDVRFHHLVAIGCQNARKAVSQQVVANVSEVQRLVCVRRRIFNHHQFAFRSFRTETVVGRFIDVIQHIQPEFRLNHDVQEALHNVKRLHRIAVSHKIFTYFLCCSFRSLLRSLQVREYDNRQVALKFFSRRLRDDA